MNEYKEILYEKQRGGALITLNRPEAMNAISRSMIKEVHQALDDAEQDKEVRAVVLTGAGGAFSVAGDVKAMNATIAAIDGPAAGAGLSLALAGDFRTWSRTAKLTTAFAKVGLPSRVRCRRPP